MIDHNIKIAFNKRITGDTLIMGLRSPEITDRSRPGQFLMLRITKGLDPLLRRPFSICGLLDNNIFCILYKVVGKGTSIMAQKKEGEEVTVLGPLGRGFQLEGIKKENLLVSGGMGIAPLIFLAQGIKNCNVQFMAGFGTREEIIDIKKTGLVGNYLTYSTDDGSEGFDGMVTDLLEEYLSNRSARMDSFSLFSCGPLKMLKRVASIASDHNIPCQVSIESAMACGIGACQGCAVEATGKVKNKTHYHLVCKDGPVFPAKNIDWNSV